MNKKLGEIIKKERKARHLTQKELGDFADTGLNFISQLERGKETVQLNKVVAVLNVLGLELYLRRGKEIFSVAKDLSK